MSATGKLITSTYESKFMMSLWNQKITLPPGKYIFMIDPVWNEAVDNDPNYREVLVDIYGPDAVSLSQVDDSVGMQVLARALKGAAINISSPDER